MKRIVTLTLVLALLTVMSGAYAGPAGTSADPLITKEYADNDYAAAVMDSLGASLDTRLQTVYNEAAQAIGADVESLPPAESFSNGYNSFSLLPGGSVSVSAGGSVILTSGDMSLASLTGEVVDVAAGSPVNYIGSSLSAGKRYFSADATLAVYTSVGGAVFLLDGPYTAISGVTEPPHKYSDVKSGIWYESAANWVYENKIFRDYKGDIFNGGGAATRAEAAYALWAAADFPETEYSAGYTDLAEDWYKTAVNWASEKGIIHGVGDSRFNPSGTFNRAMLAELFYLYVQTSGGDVSATADISGFKDADVIASRTAWASDAIAWGVATDIIHGNPDGTYAPLNNSTRANLAVLLMLFFENQ